jgi:uncharacterized protein with FMN-binding domain
MKKFLLSAAVIGAFVFYSIHKQTEDITTVSSVIAPTPAPPSMPPPGMMMSSGRYKDGQYVGDVADAFYGNVQVRVTIAGGRLTDVTFLDYPHDRRTSQEINSQAMPALKTEAITAQSASVDIVSGATQTSQAFIQSLQSALVKAS